MYIEYFYFYSMDNVMYSKEKKNQKVRRDVRI